MASLKLPSVRAILAHIRRVRRGLTPALGSKIESAYMLTNLYKANVLAASTYAIVSFFVCSNYELWLPHPVGHIFPTASVIVSVIWSLHCWQLGIARGYPNKTAIHNAAYPLAISLIAGFACWIHYEMEIVQSFKAIEWFHGSAA
ncbi:MAG: hypothetical protein HOP03_00050 [Lysobacter sp.]|nr:hypothetical protein [Lysobacter sp.]